MKKLIINKSHNIIKKIKGCFNCHKIIKNKIKNIISIKIKKNYNNIKKFKSYIKYNINMNNITKNIKNKYILEVCKYLKNIPNFKNFIKIN
ncbi:hypothetical protein [Candidatus Nasuia deltocephalinicola]|uniref:hypothetical protein n=1 Tax=Candidatus Nasuia deltocephalincola TaxID=1160784 RepID=UPI00216B3718|nr:hypothetical protein [Candidatus Nasuia deltocephalinicola]